MGSFVSISIERPLLLRFRLFCSYIKIIFQWITYIKIIFQWITYIKVIFQWITYIKVIFQWIIYIKIIFQWIIYADTTIKKISFVLAFIIGFRLVIPFCVISRFLKNKVLSSFHCCPISLFAILCRFPACFMSVLSKGGYGYIYKWVAILLLPPCFWGKWQFG